VQGKIILTWRRLEKICINKYFRDSNSLSESFRRRPVPNSHLAGKASLITLENASQNYGSDAQFVAALARAATS
jgi:hypothetical protein